MLGWKFHSKPVCDEKCIKTKVKTFNSVFNTIFWGNKIPNKVVQYTCIATINTDSDMKVDEKNYPQVYLEECRYEGQGMFYACESQTQDPDESGLTLEQHSWSKYFVLNWQASNILHTVLPY